MQIKVQFVRIAKYYHVFSILLFKKLHFGVLLP
jgi:hypothetical protein